uniref:RelA/SpoT domain-containing protein n=1 Tax=Helicotheca tamesis TaxID=374047 RepID=A0A7S2DWE5_9STRA
MQSPTKPTLPSQCDRVDGTSNHIRRRRKMRTAKSLSPLALLVLLLRSSPSHSFSPSISQGQRQSLTNLRFRHSEDNNPQAPAADAAAAAAAAGFFADPNTAPFVSPTSNMPTWLRTQQGHLADEKLHYLYDLMLNSYLTNDEAVMVARAVKEAAGGDANKEAGAVDFLLILVETMELDAPALIAAAFHYCTCVTARENSAAAPHSFPVTAFWDHHGMQEGETIKFFDEHASIIARDAARLKRTETVAGSTAYGDPAAADYENFRSLLLTVVTDWRALAIRSAACLYRLRGLLSVRNHNGQPKLTPEEIRISREALKVYAPLASRLGMHRLKNELEGAAFRILYRRQYEAVTSLALQKRRGSQSGISVGDGMKGVLTDVADAVRQALGQDLTLAKYAADVEVTARVKEPYSLWKKMLKNRAKSILDIPDALALRVVLNAKKLAEEEDVSVTRARERALCYYVQKKCTDRWRPLPDNGRFKDYIEMPKPNGYQSLHYSAFTQWADEYWPFEIQVRTGEMHRVAEFGVASHFDYKEGQQNNSKHNGESYRLDQTTGAYLKSVQEWHWQQSQGPSSRISYTKEGVTPYIEALSTAQSNLAREHVFVFLESSQLGSPSHSNGKLLSLPSGARVLDALREGSKSLGIRIRLRDNDTAGIAHNGGVTNMTQKLRNGDVLSVVVENETVFA